MRFVRGEEAFDQPHATAVDADGHPTLTRVVVRDAVNDVVLGDGISTFITRYTHRLGGGSELIKEEVTSIPLATTYSDDATFFINFNGGKDVGSKIWVMLRVVDLGSATDLRTLIEFEDPDHPDIWFPSRDGIARNIGTVVGHEFAVTTVGNYITLSREEHTQFTRARVRFRVEMDAPNGSTQIWATWHHSGGIAGVPEQ